jgi:hypothetical protein
MRPGRSGPEPMELGNHSGRAETARVRCSRALAVPLGALALLAPATAGAYFERSVGTAEQIAWVRRAADRFVTAELAANGSQVCAILNAPLRATVNGRTCERRWTERLRALLTVRGARSRLRSEQRAARSGRVVVHGNVASIELPEPLLRGPNRFLWTENCWMLVG